MSLPNHRSNSKWKCGLRCYPERNLDGLSKTHPNSAIYGILLHLMAVWVSRRKEGITHWAHLAPVAITRSLCSLHRTWHRGNAPSVPRDLDYIETEFEAESGRQNNNMHGQRNRGQELRIQILIIMVKLTATTVKHWSTREILLYLSACLSCTSRPDDSHMSALHREDTLWRGWALTRKMETLKWRKPQEIETCVHTNLWNQFVFIGSSRRKAGFSIWHTHCPVPHSWWSNSWTSLVVSQETCGHAQGWFTLNSVRRMESQSFAQIYTNTKFRYKIRTGASATF